MGDGERDAFTENDAIGNYNAGTSFLARFKNRNHRKKNRKHRGKNRRAQKRHRHKRNKKSRSHSSRKSRSGIKYTKKGQPYKIMPNGRARFLKKR